MNEPALTQHVQGAFEVQGKISSLINLIECAPYLLSDEDKATDIGMQILSRLREVRVLNLQHIAHLAQAAGTPSPAVIAALDKSLEGAFKAPPKRSS